MSKLNIYFNGANYSINKQALADTTAEMKIHLSTVMNGSGATINLDGTSYNIDSTKLTTATNAFITHLGTIAGSGSMVVVNGVEYNVDSTKMDGAIADMHNAFNNLQSGDSGGEGGSLPISWNSLAVAGNPSVDAGDGMVFVKISDETVSEEEFNNSILVANMDGMEMSLECQNVASVEGAALSTYSYDDLYNIMVASVATTNEIYGYGIAFPEVGLYALDASQMGEIDFTLVDCRKLPTPAAPDAPTVEHLSATQVILKAIDGCEYSNDGVSWQNDPEFFYLKPETEYTFYVRYKATATHNVSESSSVVVSTARRTILADKYNLKDAGYYTDETTDLIIPSFYYNDENERVYVVGINSSAFMSCNNLTSVIINDGATSIGDEAFNSCSNLASVTIPDSVTSIGTGAFFDCSSLVSVIIPDSVTTIGNYAFQGCNNLTSINIPYGVENISYSLFQYCRSLTEISIPNSVTSIGDYAFASCSSLTSIIIPDGVASIGKSAFSNCGSLSSVTIPASVTSIGESAFDGGHAVDSILPAIVFKGTIAQWNSIEKDSGWFVNKEHIDIICSDGTISI